MKIVVSSIFLLLAFSILSFGMPTFANAQSTIPPLSVSTDFPAYAENSEIIISGIVKDSSLSEYEQPITLMIVNSDGNIVKIAQLTLTSNNDFSTTLVAGGPLWKSGGEYTVKVNYGAQKAETTFNYAGLSAPSEPEPVVEEPVVIVEEPEPVVEEPVDIIEPEPEPEPLCGEGTVMKDGKCVAEKSGGGGCKLEQRLFIRC